jgi:hypothetical protein
LAAADKSSRVLLGTAADRRSTGQEGVWPGDSKELEGLGWVIGQGG